MQKFLNVLTEGINKMTSGYTSLAKYYDRLNSEIDYGKWADFIKKQLDSFGIKEGSLVLDLGCGTGNITIPLAERGYDMIGIDGSPDMLNEALLKAQSSKKEILWLCQDMRSFELYGTVAATVCCLDSLNYLTGKRGFEKCLSLVHNYLDPDGIFIFDVNTPYKFQNVYADNHYILEADGVFCGWKNCFDQKSGLCDFDLTLFVRNEDGTYERSDETQTERCYSKKAIEAALINAGFELISVSSDFSGTAPKDTDERWFFVSRAKK